ncbi:hypothetical protein Acsp03_11400 [Actinomadura sp. NBRC 104412]|uniref:hypothetical protein n=1 Tax=Actinomadura sp. NBRC 104412 TaxID=3032203 RepID=UPI0024A526B7|nr:hypothetical protein [Actinomadura sp. NBRC 104412]GLZ03673.1 hypothetical protein Acsp03_11400 [Actinomadura sp. NBRC 104412]
MQSAGTLHGQLQRGLGRAARRAADRPGAGEYVYDCIRRDPRWDPQCETRSLYYARLMVDLELPVRPVAEHLFDPADQGEGDERRVLLALRVLTDLARLSRREAAGVLRRYAEEGTHWLDAVEALIELGDPGPAAGMEALVDARCDDATLNLLIMGPSNPVIESWAARRPRIADALSRVREKGRLRRTGTGSGAADRSRRSEDELLELARRRDDAAVGAIFELGRRRAPGLLDLAEELLPQRPSRWGGAVCRALREYGPEALPRARAWASTRGGCADMGLAILARYGTRQDIPLLMTELHDALERRDWGDAAGPIEGLGRLRAGEAVPLLKSAWTESTYAFLRPRVLTALTRTAPHTAESYTIEGLWDCEEGVRQVASQTAPLTRETRIRLQRLHHDEAEEPGVRAAAASRLMQH